MGFMVSVHCKKSLVKIFVVVNEDLHAEFAELRGKESNHTLEQHDAWLKELRGKESNHTLEQHDAWLKEFSYLKCGAEPPKPC